MSKMRTNHKTTCKLVVLLLLILVGLPIDLFAQGPPPPPGVPLDFGLSALIVGCVTYGVVQMKKDNDIDSKM